MYKQINLFSDAARNISHIKDELGNNSDLLIREFDIQIKKNIYKLAVLFISGLADENKLESLSNELNELIYLGCCDNQRSSKSFFNKSQIGREDLFSRLKTSLLCNSKIIEGSDFESLYSQILSGNTVILLDGYNTFLALSTYGPKGRSISEPTSQTIIRGPKEAFTEKLEVNISLIRRIIKDKSMKIENTTIGGITKTNVAVIYLDTIAKVHCEIVCRISSKPWASTKCLSLTRLAISRWISGGKAILSVHSWSL